MAVLLLFVPCRGEAAEAWIVAIVGGPEIVVTVASVTDEGVPLVDAAALAGALDLTIVPASGYMLVRDGRGGEWRAVDGSSSLNEVAGAGGSIPSFVRIRDAALHLPLSTIARLAHKQLLLDPVGRAYLLPGPSTAADRHSETAPPGWESFTVEKTLAEKQEAERLDESPGQVPRPELREVLPARHESMQVQLGVGSAAGADWAGEIDATGTIGGYRTSGLLFATVGAQGVEYRNATLLVQPSKQAWALQTGDLLSEARGIGRGVRFSWGLNSRWHQRVSMERSRDEFASPAGVASYGAELAVSSAVMAAGETASDGSLFLKGRYGQGSATLDGFWRRGGARGVTQSGGLLSYNIWGGVSIGAGARTSSDEEHAYLLGVTLPMKRFGNISVQQTRTARAGRIQTATGISASLPVGPFRLFERFHWADTGLNGDHAGSRVTGQQLQSVAVYSPNPRVQFMYQSATQWYPGGASRVWDEVTTSLQLRRSTSLYTTTAFPRVLDSQRLRVRLTHSLGTNTTLSIEYGHLPTFQPTPVLGAERPRVLVMLRRGFGVRTPARGGQVSGRLIDEGGRPLPGALVRLGEYSTATSADGTYSFKKVPDGQYELELDKAHLPANYTGTSGTQLGVTSRTSQRIDLYAVPLNSIGGRVYIDLNGNQQFDRGEEAAGVVVGLSDRVTMTDPEGRYSFYNLAPGSYTAVIDLGRLRSDLEPVSPSEVEFQLTPDGLVPPLDFLLRVKRKPVRMQEPM